jgi:hypothetical protein
MAAVQQDELKEGFSGPAIHSDRFLITIHPSGVRIAFSEHDGVSGPPHFRAAVLLSYQDAISMRDLLSELMSGIEEQLKAAQSKIPSHA